MIFHLTVTEKRPTIARFICEIPRNYFHELKTNRPFCLIQVSSLGMFLVGRLGPMPLGSILICLVGTTVGIVADFRQTRRRRKIWKEQKTRLEFFLKECQRLATEMNQTPEWDTAKRRELTEQFDVVHARLRREGESAFGKDFWNK